MNQTPKFPDMRPPTPLRPINLPSPSAYVQRIPVFATTDGSVKSRRFERKRLLAWFGLAVALHAVLLLVFWLIPTLRIKWEPSPDAWVQVTSLPEVAPPEPIHDVANVATAVPAVKNRRARSTVKPAMGPAIQPPVGPAVESAVEPSNRQ